MYIIKKDCKYGKRGAMISDKEFKSLPYSYRSYFEKFSAKDYISEVKVDNDLTRRIMDIPQPSDLSFEAFRELNFPDPTPQQDNFQFGGGDFGGSGAGGDW